MFIQPFAVAQKETIVQVGETMLNPILNQKKSVVSIPLPKGITLWWWGHMDTEENICFQNVFNILGNTMSKWNIQEENERRHRKLLQPAAL